MAREMSKLQQIDQNGGQVDEQAQANLMKTGLNVFWTMGKIEVKSSPPSAPLPPPPPPPSTRQK